MRPLHRPLAKLAFFLAAAPVAIAAARRVSRLDRALAFDDLLAELRKGSPPIPRWLARNPVWLAGTVEALLPLLPPRSWGTCLRRALVLLSLWSRCGLEPRLHLGLRKGVELRDAHAWLTAKSADGGAIQASGPLGHEEAFQL